MPYLIYLCFSGLLTFSTLHSLKLSLCEITYDKTDASIMISFRLFTDDLASAIKNETPFIDWNKSKEQINTYLEEHFDLMVNDSIATLYFFSKSITEEVAEINYLVPNVETLQQLSVKNSILLELFKQQKNIVKWMQQNHNQTIELSQERQTAILNIK